MLNESGYALGDCWTWMLAHNVSKRHAKLMQSPHRFALDTNFEEAISPIGEERISELLSGQALATVTEARLFANGLGCSVEDIIYIPHPIVGTLPKRYRKKACEFLSKHDAFDTEFAVGPLPFFQDGFIIEWNDGCVNLAEFAFFEAGIGHSSLRWVLSWIDNSMVGSIKSNECRVSQDFRNFIQQFKVEVQK